MLQQALAALAQSAGWTRRDPQHRPRTDAWHWPAPTSTGYTPICLCPGWHWLAAGCSPSRWRLPSSLLATSSCSDCS